MWHRISDGYSRRVGYRPHGIDLSAASLAVARGRQPASRLVRGDLGGLPYGAASFDAVVCAGSTLSFVDEPGRAVAEIARVMRRGRGSSWSMSGGGAWTSPGRS